jgi:hypothetical protein
VQVDAYDPAANSWRTTATTPLIPREGATFVWTGTELIVAGGWGDAEQNACGGYKSFADGAAYSPSTNTWKPIAPAPRQLDYIVGAVWTGSEMLVVDAVRARQDTIYSYRPSTNSWRTVATRQVPAKSASSFLWAGSGLFDWVVGTAPHPPAPKGFMFNPITSKWAQIPAPPKAAHVDIVVTGYGQPIVWTGKQVFFGGQTYNGTVATSHAVLYDPAKKAWRVLPGAHIPFALDGVAVWAGHQIFYASQPATGTFDPATNTWQRLPDAPPTAPGPEALSIATDVTFPDLVWTGTQVLILGGNGGAQANRNDGVIWTP